MLFEVTNNKFSGKRGVVMRFPYFEVSGPDGASFCVEMKADRLTIGRYQQFNDIALEPDPQQLVTRKAHCTVERDSQGCWIIDNGSVNRTFVRRGASEAMQIVHGRALLQEGDSVCILGRLLDQTQVYWELAFHDPQRTSPTELSEPLGAYLEYDWLQARLYRIEHGERREIVGLRPQEHKLIRYMDQRNRANGNVPVLCTFEELIGAIWGDEPHHTDADVRHVAWELRRKLETDYRNPRFIQAVRGLGYRLNTRPAETP